VAAKTFKECGVKRLVVISGGRGNPNDVGPSGPLAEMEKAFDATGIATRHIRCGLFMEGIFYWRPQLKFTGSFSLPVDGNYKIALESAKDIGVTAARILLDNSWSGQQGIDVDFHDSLSPNEIAMVLSKVLGQSITFKQISGDEFKDTLIKYKVSPSMAQALKEMYQDIENGSLNGTRPVASASGLTLEEWASQTLKPNMTWVAVIWSVIFGK
jgi:uncharacterized protein YbjT (DUF2867 family)